MHGTDSMTFTSFWHCQTFYSQNIKKQQSLQTIGKKKKSVGIFFNFWDLLTETMSYFPLVNCSVWYLSSWFQFPNSHSPVIQGEQRFDGGLWALIWSPIPGCSCSRPLSPRSGACGGWNWPSVWPPARSFSWWPPPDSKGQRSRWSSGLLRVRW